MPLGYGMPRGNFTRNQRLAQMLQQQEQAAGPVRSHSQGIAQLLRSFMAGQARRADETDRTTAQEGLMKGYAAKPWVDPDIGAAMTPETMPPGQFGPPQLVPTAPAGGMEGMISSQQGMGDNPYARRNLSQLLQTKMGQDYKAGIAKTAREQTLADEKRKALSASGVLKEQRSYDEGLVQTEKESLWEKNRKLIEANPSLAPFLEVGPDVAPGDTTAEGGSGQDVLGTPSADFVGGDDVLSYGAGDSLIGGAGQDVPAQSSFSDMPTMALQALTGHENPMVAAMAKGELARRETGAEQTQKSAKQTFDVGKERTKTALAQQSRFTKESGTFIKVRDAYGRVRSSAKSPSPAGDLSMIFNYMKILDPGSVVRESEFATAAATGSYGERIKAGVQRVLGGERLSPKMRKDFADRAGKLYYEQRRSHTKTRKEYKRLATEYGVRPERVILDYYGDYITKEDFDATAREAKVPLEEVFRLLGQRFDVGPDYMRSIYEETD